MNEPDPNDLDLLLCRYLDGQLGRRERRRFEQRLEGDEALRDELRRYGALDGLLGELGRGDVEGVDYDLQRAEIITAIEKRALLTPARRRTLVLRPRFLVTAAAASLLLAVSAGLVVLSLGWGAGETPIAMMVMPGGAPTERGVQEISVQTAPLELDELPIDVQASPRRTTPAGTILVSFGSPSARLPEAAEPMIVY